LEVNKNRWLNELASIKEYFAEFGNRLPKAMKEQLHALEKRLEEY
jgi:phosphoenolpyruvate carboxykinase (GTP)